MKILAIEPYYKGSHKAWIDQYRDHSAHDLKLLTLPGKHWKWRMHGASLELSKKFLDLEDYVPDLILFTDMMDVNLFLSLTRSKTYNIKTALYFHENQFAYPKSEFDQDKENQRDDHYGFINYTSGLCVDQLFFNSEYNRKTYLTGCKNLIKKMPDFNSLIKVKELEKKSEVLRLGLNLKHFQGKQVSSDVKTILWNHRWEYDKNPESFFKTLFRLKDENIPFKLNLIGPRNKQAPPIFMDSLETFKDNLLHSHKVDSVDEYNKILEESDIIPVTSNQEFFGISATEAICAGVIPLFPNRLAFPELIPNQYHSEFLYQSDEELYSKLKSLLSSEVITTDVEAIRNHCLSHDWTKLASVYDVKLSSAFSN
jgi:glycosyltransferase involved in cell wall biosynthesis